MTPCNALSDRMPDVALGRSRWTPDEERHLAGCAECGSEWAIVATASRLRPPGRVAFDAERTTRNALTRLAAERARGRTRLRRWMIVGVAAAAVMALAVWTGHLGPSTRRGGSGVPPAPAPVAITEPKVPPLPAPRAATAPAPVEIAMPELDSLPEAALDSILRVLDEPLAQAGDDSQGNDDGDLELERVLAGLEG